MEGENKATEFVVIPMHTFIQYLEFRTRYMLLSDHIKQSLDKWKAENKYSTATYNDAFFKAVVGWEEGKEKEE